MMKKLTPEETILLFCFFAFEAVKLFESLDEKDDETLLVTIREKNDLPFKLNPVEEFFHALKRAWAAFEACSENAHEE